ncbi:hypothetical protein [Pedobacter endophyticus]|uniref:DUF4136 domain-containing protein n=1 Tax=Pedobacter endophyticus TaxID=2789740 RepID=A0A7U3SQ91_9SPHI|nr:hypothetical protein [Pedobacter endophyticus]QPH38066.1 hypothetical protein IZT61_13255 [Pedobacter endophyticus]
MKKLFLMLVVTALAIHVKGQKQIFEGPSLKNEIPKHKIVAILPFSAKITYKKLPKGYDAAANKEQEDAMSKSIQSSMYTYLLRKSDNYSVKLQDIDKTNILLKKAGIDGKLDETTKDEIAKILGVDALISGTYNTESTKSEAGAIATSIIGLGGKTGTGKLTMLINNGSDGEMLWRFTKTMDDGISTSTDELVEQMMRKVSRNFPYSK